MRSRWSATVLSSSSARPVSAFTGGLSRTTVATSWSAPGTALYCTVKKRYCSKRVCSRATRWRRCQRSAFGRTLSTLSGLRSVVVSPTGSPDSSAASVRRMYFPERVSGNASTSMKASGTATTPFSWRTRLARRFSTSAVRLSPSRVWTKATGTSPFSLWGAPTTTTFATGVSGVSCLSRSIAPSSSSVPRRCPETFITSSERPCRLTESSSYRLATSPWR